MDAVYEDLGINVGALGYVMLKVQAAPVTIDDLGGTDAMYISRNPKMPWVNGFVNGKKPHITLLYGLLSGIQQKHVDAALADWTSPTRVFIRSVGIFPSPNPTEEPYVCVVAHVDVEPLRPAHNKLRALPHIQRYPDFKAHLTLGYIRQLGQGAVDINAIIVALTARLAGTPLDIIEQRYDPAGTVI